MQRWLGLLGAAGAGVVLFAACGGKVVVESSGATGAGNGGAGGAGGSTSTQLDGPFSAIAVGVTSTAAVTTAAVTAGSGASCVSCNMAASGPINMVAKLCPAAENPYNDLFVCACAASGACPTQCSATMCIGEATSNGCIKCLNEPGMGCGVELKNCLAN